MMSQFEEWFQLQSFYLNLRFIHGDRLFASENCVYRILAVQIAWVSWMDHQKQVDILTDWLKEADASQEKMQSIVDEQQKRIEYLQLKASEDSRILHNVIEIETKKNSELQKQIDELESKLNAVDALSRMRAAVIGSFNTQNLNARTKRKMLILKQAEQALKGGDE